MKNRISKEEREIRKIEHDIQILRDKLIEKVPEHFNVKDLAYEFFGALLVGLTFVFKGALIRTVAILDPFRIFLITLATLAILIAEIYFIGYSRVKDKKTRKLGQFMTKRLFSLYFTSLFVAIILVNLFGVNILAGNVYETIKVIIVITMPCAVGAAIPSLLKQY